MRTPIVLHDVLRFGRVTFKVSESVITDEEFENKEKEDIARKQQILQSLELSRSIHNQANGPPNPDAGSSMHINDKNTFA